jgi:hypothetical protein
MRKGGTYTFYHKIILMINPWCESGSAPLGIILPDPDPIFLIKIKSLFTLKM